MFYLIFEHQCNFFFTYSAPSSSSSWELMQLSPVFMLFYTNVSKKAKQALHKMFDYKKSGVHDIYQSDFKNYYIIQISPI